MKINCIIVGGGIIGLMTARELALEGLEVKILEKGKVGRESSWAGGGILSPLYPWKAPETIWPMIMESQKIYPQLCTELKEETKIDPQWIQSGLLILEQVDLAHLDYWANKTGSPYQRLDAKQIFELEPKLNQEIGSAIWLPEVAQVRNPRLIEALRKSLLQQGVDICEKVEVARITQIKEKVTGVETTQGRIAADIVVVAAGAWSSQFLPDTSLIKPIRGQMLLMDIFPELLKRIILREDVYLIPRKDGKLLIGSSVEDVGFDKRVTREVAEGLYRQASRLVPSLSNYAIVKQWAGLRPGSVQGIPIIKESEEVSGLFVNAGHFRNGVALAIASAKRIRNLIAGQSGQIF